MRQDNAVLNDVFITAFQKDREYFIVFVVNPDGQVCWPVRQLNQQGEQRVFTVFRKKILFCKALDELVDYPVRAFSGPVFAHGNRAGREPVRPERFLLIGSSKFAHGCCFQHGYFLIATWMAGVSKAMNSPKGSGA
ncbi:hypothetical protein QO021_25240 [Pseudomonas amygdali pv. lachrymans]|nr:hypothetical protein [Pseudomonas amygdali]WIO57739.1 hypothetical protein QO021_25240 [Pseudomonas amygdali pv. lachrymans]